jgi:HEAT repeat protein
VWATDNFVSLLSQEEQDNLAWDNLGERQLAKDWGAKVAENRAKKGIALCERLLSMGNEAQRLAALDNLAKVPDEASVRILLSYAQKTEESEKVRRMAIASLEEMRNTTVVPDLLQIAGAKDEPPSVVSAAVIALGKMGDRRAFDRWPGSRRATSSKTSIHTFIWLRSKLLQDLTARELRPSFLRHLPRATP